MPPASPDPSRPALPPGFGLALDAGTRRRDEGRVLIGGAPLRILRLSAAGSATVDELTAGGVVAGTPAAGALARRLTDAGLAHPRPPRSGVGLTTTVVVPVRDGADDLRRLLDSVGDAGPVVVVDDGSVDAAAVSAAAAASAAAGRTRVLRHPVPRGPGAARATGAGAADSDLVAFVDADVELPSGWLAPLVAHFADPCVGAVAPRVEAVAPSGRRDTGPGRQGRVAAAVAAYDRARSPLDMGPRPALVRPGGPVPYVPSAALVVRCQALSAVGGFDPALQVGEDVDLVWRLDRAGWVVRYEPAVSVRHAVRPSARAWARQRFRYGTSAAPLAVRHPTALSPLRVSASSAAAWAAAGLGCPAAAVAVVAATTAALAPRLAGLRHPWTEAIRLAGQGHLLAGSAAASTLRREWWPLALVAALSARRTRPAVAAALLVPPLHRWLRTRPALSPAAWVALHLADDAAYGAGVWAGCLRVRTAAPLLPDLAGWPGHRRAVEEDGR